MKVLFSFYLFLTAKLFAAEDGMSFIERISPPEDISENGHLIDWLFNYITIMDAIFFFFVCLGIFGFSYLYSAKRSKRGEYTYGNRKGQILVATAIGALVFFCIDLNITRIANNDYVGTFINWPKADEDVVKVQVLAQQWMWNVRYAGKDQTFNTEDDVVTTNDLRLPTGKKIVVQVLSKDVIHSFSLPNVRRKVDAIPGRITRIWFQLKKTGNYEIVCAEMCGTAHYKMRGEMTVYSPQEYQAWLDESQSIAVAENDPENADQFWGWKWEN